MIGASGCVERAEARGKWPRLNGVGRIETHRSREVDDPVAFDDVELERVGRGLRQQLLDLIGRELGALLEQQGLPEAELVQLKRKLHLE